MGVSGSGKTTIGKLLAQALGVEFVESDEYHPPENIAKLRRGVPLDDDDRSPWLKNLRAEIDRWLAAGKTVILACSALKQSYRDVLAKGRSDVRFVYLRGDESLIGARLEQRRGHYLPKGLLASQIRALEEPVDVTGTPEEIVADLLGRLDQGA